jgi:hypothetical protein
MRCLVMWGATALMLACSGQRLPPGTPPPEYEPPVVPAWSPATPDAGALPEPAAEPEPPMAPAAPPVGPALSPPGPALDAGAR